MFDPSVPEETRFHRLAHAADAFESTRLVDGLTSEVDEAETRRLQVLQSYHLLDTGPEPAFDDIANIASLMCGTPIAMVSLIASDRQWSKARVGMDQAEVPRDQAFCSHAIRNPTSIMEVQDASKDPRFMFNPLVIGESGIRFYAGAPLLSPSGAALGTVCVIDRVPRQLTPAMAQGLQALARQAGELLALRRANSDLETLNQSVMEMQMELEQHQVKLEDENADLIQSSPTDPVTGLTNQRTFERLFAEEMLRVERTQSSLALLVAEIDNFSVFARDFGVVAQDDALRRLAKVLKTQARGYDTLACLDSRRFAVLMPGADDAELAAVAARLHRAVASMKPVGRALRVSVGVTMARPLDAPLSVLTRATSALERATSQGGDQIVVAKG